jgi:hypothetical protein
MGYRGKFGYTSAWAAFEAVTPGREFSNSNFFSRSDPSEKNVA